jgi:uncharacterized protein (TIGR03086 family)
MKPPGAFALSRVQLEQHIAAVSADTLPLPTPCAGWTVRDLTNHVIGGAIRYRMLLEGATAQQLDGTRTQDHIAGDALAAAVRHGDALAAAIARASPERIVHHPAGDRTAAALVTMRVFEQALHGWDLARALNRNASPDKRICRYLLRHLHLIGELRGAGYYAAARPAATTDPCEELLAATGRDTTTLTPQTCGKQPSAHPDLP